MKTKRVLIIGGGIAGLCAGIYLRKNGFETEILEMHSIAGGLATAWKRKGYTFENCIHWFVGSKSGEDLNATWKEVFDIGKLQFYHDPVYQVLEKNGVALVVYRDVERMEREFLVKAPEDAVAIRQFAKFVRKLSSLKMPGGGNFFVRLISYVKAIRYVWWLSKYSRFTLAAYAERFTNPLLKHFFASGFGDLSLLAIAFSLAWMSRGNAGYPIGGSLSVVDLLADNYRRLGGTIRFGARVERIQVENNRAAGVILEGGETIAADAVISAADGHSTIFHLLQGRFVSDKIEKVFETYRPFPSYIQVSLGINTALKDEPGFLELILKRTLVIDPKTHKHSLSFRIFNFDPTFAPAGKTAVVCFVTTYNSEYWVNLREANKPRYDSEKERISRSVMDILEERFPAVRGKVEVVDVATPATVVRYTGNWKGSMEGWLMTPATGAKQLPLILPQLKSFYMIGHWVSPGGGLPSGLLTARKAARMICRENGIKFKVA